MSDLTALKMPEHAPEGGVPNKDFQDRWHNERGVICRASTFGGYAHQQPDGRLHCNRCGWVTPNPVVTTYSERSGKTYLTWDEWVLAETNGWVVVVTTSRPGTGPIVTGPFLDHEEAKRARARIRAQVMREESRYGNHKVASVIRVLDRP